MRIVVTGASGFVGSNLWGYLKDVQKDFIIEPYNRSDGIQQLQKIPSFSAIIHLAGKAHDLKNVADSSEYYSANYEFTKQIFNAFLQSSAEVFIFMSSVKAVADNFHGILEETVKPSPQTHYGKSKLLAENFIMESLYSPNKRVYILRPSMIHGPGNKGNLNSLFKLVRSGIPWPLGRFVNKRSYCSIENICFVIKELILRKEIPSGIYNASDDCSVSTNEIVDLISRELKSPNRKINVPKSFVYLFLKGTDFFNLKFFRNNFEKLTGDFEVSNKKIKSVLNVDMPVDALEGLRKSIKSLNTK
jgi:nucleoside-diphosphate-sugar epimerase